MQLLVCSQYSVLLVTLFLRRAGVFSEPVHYKIATPSFVRFQSLSLTQFSMGKGGCQPNSNPQDILNSYQTLLCCELFFTNDHHCKLVTMEKHLTLSAPLIKHLNSISPSCGFAAQFNRKKHMTF